MNRIRVIVAGIVGGLLMFVGGFLVHAVAGSDFMVKQDLPAEERVVSAITDTISQRGWYVFPGIHAAKKSEEAKKEVEEKMKKGPTGLIIYNPGGFEMNPQTLGTEFVSNVAVCIILSAVLVRVSASKATRIALAALMGAAAWMAIDVSYWNWDSFPNTFVIAGLVEQVFCWLLAGIGITLVLGRHIIAAPISAQT